MEGWDEDIHEKLVVDVSACYDEIAAVGNIPASKKPNCSQGRLAQTITDKKEQNFLLQLFCPLQYFDHLITNDTDIGLELQFCTDSRFFVTSKQGVQPKIKIKG